MNLFLFLALTFIIFSSCYPQEVCDDADVKCPIWKSYCDNPSFKFFMEMNCRKTCDMCPKCEDLGLQCRLQSAFCMDANNAEYMKKNCAKTCGYCIVPTTPPPPPTPSWKVVPAGECGTPKIFQGRVINGVNARKGAWPWQILMRFIGEPHCGGSIISPYWIVTAAHCVDGKQALMDEFKIVVGEHDFRTNEGEETEIGVRKIIVHEEYKPNSFANDIALVKLSRPVPFDTYVGTICLPEQSQHLSVGTDCFITGWGWVKNGPWSEMHHILQQARLPVVDSGICHTLNKNTTNIPVTSKMVCGGFGHNAPTGGCHGDSGGPYVCRTGKNGKWELQGLVSWGSASCNTKEAYTVFVRVSEFKDWIDANMNEN